MYRSRAASLGTAHFPTEYTIFLNTDIRLEPDFIVQLIAVADSDPSIACGGAAPVRRSAFMDAGGYDTGFYMYHEDVDLCWRFWLLGHRVVTAPHPVVYHKFSRSTRANRDMTWRELIGERNNVRAMIKNYELPTLIRSLRDLLRQPQKPERRKQMLRNLRWNVLHLPQTSWRRVLVQRRRQRTDSQVAPLIDPRPEVPVDTSGFTLGEIKSF